jgi:hypothetical protein
MKSFPFLQSDEAQQVAEGVCQFSTGVICALVKQGAIDLPTFVNDLERWHELKKDQPEDLHYLNPVADELFDRILIQMRDVLIDVARRTAEPR